MLTEESKARYKRFWNREETDRCVLYIVAPKEVTNSKFTYMQPKNLYDRWTNKELIHNNMLYGSEHAQFVGDGFESLFVNLGPGCLAACISDTFELAEDTVWFDTKQYILDWNNYKGLKLNKESDMYKIVKNIIEYSLSHSERRYYTSVTDIGGNFDVLASLRGTENLLYDMYDNPEVIKKASEDIDKLWIDFYSANIENMIKYQDGYTSWMPIWNDKKWFPLQCDYSAMISPEMFGEFILPSLQRQTKYLENSVYHLDGPGEIPHLDQLLSIKELNAIQWTPGSGNSDVGDSKWFPLYRKIQDSGKGLILLGARSSDIKNILSNISSKGLYISSWCGSIKEAEDIVRTAEELA
jgi:5-methyltetrahydrofolate--homocysteine methyltransferase